MLIGNFVEKITPKWRKMLDLPFLKGIIGGSLEKKLFLEYLIQDTIYLKDYAKCYAYAITKTDNIEVMRILYDCLGIISKDESCVHIIYLKDLGYTESRALCKPIHEVNRKYLDYMLYFSKHGTLAQNITCLVPCALSYFYIAKECKKIALDLKTYHNNYYKKWIDFYSGSFYEQSCEKLIDLCSLILNNLSSDEINNLYEIFEKSTHYENLFWQIPKI